MQWQLHAMHMCCVQQYCHSGNSTPCSSGIPLALANAHRRAAQSEPPREHEESLSSESGLPTYLFPSRGCKLGTVLSCVLPPEEG